jgi:serine/threonine protein kinase/tetratricopeptide (TPR) repeat protein
MNLQRLGKYLIEDEIGRGTMGTVYRARDPILNRHVAIKTMVASTDKSDESRQRFQREAQAAALLSHPNIVTVHDFGEEQGLIYMAMELLDGDDLRNQVGTSKLASLDAKLRVMEQVADGLRFAHSKGVVHRDLKPANIYIQPGGQVKIVDFGLAHVGGSDMTQEGVVLGTPNYMSPEQALGDKVDSRTDVFSAGVVFYELLTNKKPFDAETTPGVLYQVVHKEPVSIRQWTPDVPSILVEVVERALTKDKEQRFQNGRQLWAALGLARQAIEGGRADRTTLAEEQRASKEGRKNDSSRGGMAPPIPRDPWVEGNVALDPGSVPPPARPNPGSSGRLSPTLSGRAPTYAERNGVRGPGRPKSTSPLVWLWVGAFGGLLLLVAGAGGYFYFGSPPPGLPSAPPPVPTPDPAKAEVGALTAALIETQTELASKDLENKNYAGAVAQAERALKLAPGSAKAKQILEQAKSKRAELDAAAAEARSAFTAGNLTEASQALSKVLELDPQHPVVGDLTPRLNSTFRSRAEEAGRQAGRARTDAERAKAQGQDVFVQAVTTAAEGEALFKRSEYADATQRYLEARDAFDRARRSASAPPTAKTGPSAPGRVIVAPEPSPSLSGPATTSAPASPDGGRATATEPPRGFFSGKSVVASAKSGGDLAGFDTSDVKTKKIPDLVGRLEFEVRPAAARAGDNYTVQVYLVNQGKKAVHLKALSFTIITNGKRLPSPGTLLERDVGPQQRVLVGELPGQLAEFATTWSLETVVTSDRDETCTSRLGWPQS